MCAEHHPTQHQDGPGWEQLGPEKLSPGLKGRVFGTKGEHTVILILILPPLLLPLSCVSPHIPIVSTTGLSQRKSICRNRRE